MEVLLKKIEQIGNKLPNVSILFFYALILVLLLSCGLSFIDFPYHLIQKDGSAGEQIVIKNFLSLPNFLEFLSASVKNFINFPPLAITLVVAFGIGIAEQGGFLKTALLKVSAFIPKSLVVPAVLLLSIASHLIADGAYVFLMPIAAMLFYSAGRHPVAGIATAFAGLAGGFTASFTPSVIDPIMQSFTQNAAHILDTSIQVHVLCNYFVSLGGVVGVMLLCWFVCDKIIEPFLQKNLPIDMPQSQEEEITPLQNKALLYALISIVCFVSIIIILAIPQDSILRGSHGSLSEKDAFLIKALVPILFLIFAIPGFIFGKITKTISSLQDVFKAMEETTKPLIGFLVFCFVCGQFLYIFNQSNLSKLLAISGAEFLKSLALPSGVTIFGIIVLTGILNLFITSATSKWSVLAPVFVPMLMLLGISPELTQAAFRVSDSAINVVTPLFPFYPLIISYCQKYCSKTGVGTLSSIMLPYSIALMIALTGTLYLFWFLEIPLGFESHYTYTFTRS